MNNITHSSPQEKKAHYVYRAWFRDKSGKIHWAKAYGKKCFKIPVSDET